MSTHPIRPSVASAAEQAPSSAAHGRSSHFALPQALTICVPLALGTVLHSIGTPLADILALLGSCGALGVVFVLVGGGGWRRLAAAADTLLHGTTNK
ncbi:hypothetical protein ACG5V6_24235 [Streptomyces chitinivorans]|uniref:Holin n=1 Tax=Streptomyces chitinivorans TaxID=1257027 RepID=A0ABW7HZM3_9ACTN|nr:hypothetical protein [Streptomyces chitinivorans]MDH2412365.1 hypothetical protein [Streptomyces chitinivorans]